MPTSFRVLTWALMALPPFFVFQASRAPGPVAGVLYATAAFVALLYAAVWLFWRPSAFELTDGQLVIHFPLRRRAFPLERFSAAELTDLASLQKQHGRGMRVGVGGLWGVFGLFVTRKLTFQVYVSRLDRLVLLTGAGRPLLISPAEPELFISRVGARP